MVLLWLMHFSTEWLLQFDELCRRRTYLSNYTYKNLKILELFGQQVKHLPPFALNSHPFYCQFPGYINMHQ